MWISKGESNFYLHTSIFKVILPADFNQTSFLCAVTGAPQAHSRGSHSSMAYRHTSPICFFPLPLWAAVAPPCPGWHQTSTSMLVLHYLPSKGLGQLPVVVPMPSHSQPHSPVHCSVLHTSLSGCSIVSLWTSCPWYQLELGQMAVYKVAQEDALAQAALAIQDQLNLQANET